MPNYKNDAYVLGFIPLEQKSLSLVQLQPVVIAAHGCRCPDKERHCVNGPVANCNVER